MTGATSFARTPGRFAASLALIIVLAALLRGVFPYADPPWTTTVGIVWHDEGAWVHNARNKALFGRWSEDAWNPLYIAPVFTYLEYVSFAISAWAYGKRGCCPSSPGSRQSSCSRVASGESPAATPG